MNNDIVQDARTILVVAKHNKKICLFTVQKKKNKYALVVEYMRKVEKKVKEKMSGPPYSSEQDYIPGNLTKAAGLWVEGVIRKNKPFKYFNGPEIHQKDNSTKFLLSFFLSTLNTKPNTRESVRAHVPTNVNSLCIISN